MEDAHAPPPARLLPIGSTRRMLASLLLWTAATLAGAWFWKEQPPGASEWIWLLMWVGQSVIRGPHAAANRDNRIEDRRFDLSERVALPLMFLSMLLPLMHIGTPPLRFADYVAPGWAIAVGAVLGAAFLWLFWRSHRDLGRNWSAGLELRKGHALVTGGVYAWCRHPMYAAIWLGALAQPLLIHNWVAGALVIPAFALMCWTRLPKEERMMRDRFGNAYDEYAQRTPALAWWPRG